MSSQVGWVDQEMELQVECFLGVVSGGRGMLGECGGINNPIHYIRYALLKARTVINTTIKILSFFQSKNVFNMDLEQYWC